jgi:Domain of unknown function (DUF222)
MPVPPDADPGPSLHGVPDGHGVLLPELVGAGFWDRSDYSCAGFASGGAADTMAPGPVLACLAGDRWQAGLGSLTDDELIGALRAARRLGSWVAAMELAMVSDLAARRDAQAEAENDHRYGEHTDDEIAAALTMTRSSAVTLLDLAVDLRRLPLTAAALAAGQIDRARAVVIADAVTGLDDAHAAAVEAAIIAKAPRQTAGQVRAAAHRAVIAADPAAARKRKEEAQKDAAVEVWHEPTGTHTLAGRHLPAAGVLAADKRISALARDLKTAGAEGTLQQLRARVFLAVLSDQPLASLLPRTCGTAASDGTSFPPPDSPDGDSSHGAAGVPGTGTAGGPGPALASPDGATPSTPPGGGTWPEGGAWPGLSGSVNLTLPLLTWLGWSQSPGDVPGFGPLDADDSRALADLLAANPTTKWCLTLTNPDGQPAAHGCARSGPSGQPGRTGPPGGTGSPGRTGPPRSTGPSRSTGPPSSTGPPGRSPPGAREWISSIKITPFGTGPCTHQRESPAYRPPPSLQHLARIRRTTCSHPGCRRAATRCDLDHAIPYGKGGRTCPCNLHPLCRRHHAAKQAPGWALALDPTGTATWITPAGRRYTTTPTSYPS